MAAVTAARIAAMAALVALIPRHRNPSRSVDLSLVDRVGGLAHQIGDVDVLVNNAGGVERSEAAGRPALPSP
jgi:NADP-dependent 3-hydroxy acid dehydrogenase YdfG